MEVNIDAEKRVVFKVWQAIFFAIIIYILGMWNGEDTSIIMAAITIAGIIMGTIYKAG